MKYITEKEFNELELVHHGGHAKGPNNKWYVAFSKIPVGGAAILTKKEWPRSSVSLKHVVGGFRRLKYDPLNIRFNTLRDGSGWVIRRIK